MPRPCSPAQPVESPSGETEGDEAAIVRRPVGTRRPYTQTGHPLPVLQTFPKPSSNCHSTDIECDLLRRMESMRSRYPHPQKGSPRGG